MSKDKVFSVDTPEESTGFLMWQATNLWQREIRKALEAFDLTHSQFVLLASMLWFSEQRQTATQIFLSAHTKIDPMTTSTVLRALQGKGLLIRQEHSTDTRAKTVELTDAGRALAAQAVAAVERFDRIFFQPLKGGIGDFNRQLSALLHGGQEEK